jgi:YrbI family 3-deoxy-D-manno-octulosonate 8-phosphate phosphatase
VDSVVSAKKPEVLAIVPARGGSKSIPRKNAQPFLGHPLLAYSIAAGLQASSVNRVIVSTDDEALAELARQYGAEVPFMRPAEYAQDDTLDLAVFRHALQWLAKHEKYRPDIVVHLRPTSPLRPRDLVDRSMETLRANKKADSVRGVVPAGQNPHKMWTFTKDGAMQPLLKVKGVAEPYNAPRQKLPPTYWQTGHIDVIRASTILKKESMSGDVIWPVLIDPRYAADIDTPNDWRRAEWLAASSELDLVRPGTAPRTLPKQTKLLVMDFDGVFTDNRVWVDEEGNEQAAANRSDGLGIRMLLKSGVAAVVISMEDRPIVARRCEKLGIPYKKGISDKGPVLSSLLAEYSVTASEAVYIGNDTNDLPCFPLVACAVAVADAHPDVLRQADLILSKSGGHGALRELCDRILANNFKETK